jgi:HD-like signal output (HDOD) protein
MNGPNALLSKLAALKNLPTLPHILLKLIEACNNDNPDLNAIGAIVNTDPVLSAKILKLVNSAHMGLRRKVEVGHPGRDAARHHRHQKYRNLRCGV